jgi:hypothetical protein
MDIGVDIRVVMMSKARKINDISLTVGLGTFLRGADPVYAVAEVNDAVAGRRDVLILGCAPLTAVSATKADNEWIAQRFGRTRDLALIPGRLSLAS